MPQGEMRVGDIGTVLIFTLKETESEEILNISTATVKTILLKKPDGTVLTKTASFVTDGSDGKLKYKTISGDISIAGIWEAQAYIEMVAGEKWHSDTIVIKVFNNLN